MIRSNQFRALFCILTVALALGACTPELGARTPGAPNATVEPTGTAQLPRTGLEAVIQVPATLPDGDSVRVAFTLINHSQTGLYVLRWYTPLEGLGGEIFAVERDGQPIPYQGILAMRGDPTPDGYVLIDAGAAVSATVDLATAYDFSEAGAYTIAFISPRISHLASTEAEMARTVDDLGPVEIPSNTTTTRIGGSPGAMMEDAPTLPANQMAYEGGDLDALAQQFDIYIADIERQLSAQDSASFTPDLRLLDAMIESLEVAPSWPITAARTGEPTAAQQEPGEEKGAMLAAEPTLTPTFPDLPDLAPPAGGWIAFETPGEQLALISPDGSRRVPVIEEGEVQSFAWSPDGRSLAFVRGGQLTILAIGDARFTPLTPPGAIRSPGLAWSQDSHHLAYLHSLEKEGRRVAPDGLRVLDVAAREAITVSIYANTRPDERAVLCPQPFPFPLLAVKEAGFSRVVRMWDVRDREVLAELHPPSFFCGHLWLPGTPGAILTREEAEKPGIEWTCPEDAQDCIKGETRVSYPTSVIVWRMEKDSAGGEAPTVVLEGTQKQHYHPTHWLPDGRLEVEVGQFERTAYENRAQPERITYRYLAPTEDGTLRESESGDLPWWAAGGFGERFRATDLYREQNSKRPVIPGWKVGPDGETVAFTWSRRVDAEEWESAIYLWRGKGEPNHLAPGSHPQWQWSILAP